MSDKLCEKCIQNIKNIKHQAGEVCEICQLCSIKDFAEFLECRHPKFEVSTTIKNYLKQWNDPKDFLLQEVCEKLYQLQIDFDQFQDNEFSNIVNDLKKRISELERK